MSATRFTLLVFLIFSAGCGVVIADEFKPIRGRLTFSTDMSPIDIEVVGSTSQLPKFHKLLPELIIRLRLERAYVQLFAEREPGYELLSIAVDFETALPMALFEAAGTDIPEIRKATPEALRRRNIVLSIHSDRRDENFRKSAERLVACHGEAVENGMWTYERKAGCPGLGPQKFGKVAQLEDGSLSKVECDETLPTSWARCEVRFPFDGFSVGLNFDRDLLPRWREVVSFSRKFLRSKQYQPIESR